MWGFQSKPNALREQLLMQAPEVNPSEFIRRYLQQQQQSSARKPRFGASGRYVTVAGARAGNQKAPA